jgi:hypothetical protein
MEQNATEPVHQKDLAMTFDFYTYFLMFGVSAIAAILLLTFGFCRMGSIWSRREEQELDLICYGAVEGALQDFNPERQSSSR